MSKLADFIKLNKQYALDLTAIDQDHSDNVTNLNNSLNQISSLVEEKNASTAEMVSKQKEVQDILESEKQYLEHKSDAIDHATYGQKRIVQFNESYIARYKKYNELVYAVIFSMLCVGLITLQQKYFDIIPSAVNTFLYIIIFTILIIYVFYILMDIYSRDNMDFRKYKKSHPSNKQLSQDDLNKAKLNKTSKNNNSECSGQECCTDGTIYDDSIEKCIPIPAPPPSAEQCAAVKDT